MRFVSYRSSTGLATTVLVAVGRTLARRLTTVSCRKQNTVLDMASLVPALDDAFAAAGILLRPDVAEARQAAQQPAEAGISAVSRRLQHVLSKLLPG